MPPESLLVLTVAAAFLLLGIAGSPLAWALLHHRQSRLEEHMDRTWRKVAGELRAIEQRLNRIETDNPALSRPTDRLQSDGTFGPGVIRVADSFTDDERGAGRPRASGATAGHRPARAHAAHKPTLIAIPTLEGVPVDREVSVSGLKERHAAIWALADAGATVDVIAHATGQPVGQIELVLGLRRQIDGVRSSTSDGPHDRDHDQRPSTT